MIGGSIEACPYQAAGVSTKHALPPAAGVPTPESREGKKCIHRGYQGATPPPAREDASLADGAFKARNLQPPRFSRPPSMSVTVAFGDTSLATQPIPTMPRRGYLSGTERLVIASDGAFPAPSEPRPVALGRELRLPPATEFPIHLCEDRKAVQRATLHLGRDLELIDTLAVDVAWWSAAGAGTPFGLLWAFAVFATPFRAVIVSENAPDLDEIVQLSDLVHSLPIPPVVCGMYDVHDRLSQYGWMGDRARDVAHVAAAAERPVRPRDGLEAVLRASLGMWSDDGGDARLASTPYVAGVPRFKPTPPQVSLMATRAYALTCVASVAGNSNRTLWRRSWTSTTADGYVADQEDLSDSAAGESLRPAPNDKDAASEGD